MLKPGWGWGVGGGVGGAVTLVERQKHVEESDSVSPNTGPDGRSSMCTK